MSHVSSVPRFVSLRSLCGVHEAVIQLHGKFVHLHLLIFISFCDDHLFLNLWRVVYNRFPVWSIDSRAVTVSCIKYWMKNDFLYPEPIWDINTLKTSNSSFRLGTYAWSSLLWSNILKQITYHTVIIVYEFTTLCYWLTGTSTWHENMSRTRNFSVWKKHHSTLNSKRNEKKKGGKNAKGNKAGPRGAHFVYKRLTHPSRAISRRWGKEEHLGRTEHHAWTSLKRHKRDG